MDELDEYRITAANNSLEKVRTARRAKEAARALAEEFDGIKGIDYARETLGGTPDDGALMRLVELRTKRRDSMVRAVAAYDEAAQDAWRRIQTLGDDAHIQLLAFRFINDWHWERVAVQMGYSLPRVMQLRRAALLAYYSVMPPEDKRIPDALGEDYT